MVNRFWFGNGILFFSLVLTSTRLARNYSTLATPRRSVENFQLDPNWATGFVDGEGCFTCYITENQEIKTGWRVKPAFVLTLHARDRPLLEKIQKTLAVGKTYKHGSQSIQFVVTSRKDLGVCIKFFLKYKLQSQKRADFLLWMQVFELMERREHQTIEGLHKIVAIKASMNLGLSEKLRAAFPDVTPAERPLILDPKITNPHWLAGFTSGEGCFVVLITPSKTYSVGFQVILVFQLTQHSRDEKLMKSLIEFLKCGKIYRKGDIYELRIYKFGDITEKIIPLFLKYRIRGVKALDFSDFCRAASLMKDKKHLTVEGLDQIRKIKAGMNRGRKLD